MLVLTKTLGQQLVNIILLHHCSAKASIAARKFKAVIIKTSNKNSRHHTELKCTETGERQQESEFSKS